MPRINTFAFRFFHGKSPRGKAVYSFKPGDGAGHIYLDTPAFTSAPMLYSQACRLAKKEFGGYREVYVLP